MESNLSDYFFNLKYDPLGDGLLRSSSPQDEQTSIMFKKNKDKADALITANEAATSPSLSSKVSSLFSVKPNKYKDDMSWVSAGVNLLSDIAKNRQEQDLKDKERLASSANYGLNAMTAAGSALGRLNQGRMGSMGLGSMAGIR